MGYELCPNLEANSTVKAIQRALAKQEYPLIHHSDRGLQYCSKPYTEILKENNIRISMTENSDPYENAVAERVNGILNYKFDLGELSGEMVDISRQTKQSIDIYNILRPHMSCELLTPIQMHSQDKVRIKT
jgi:putative transposase